MSKGRILIVEDELIIAEDLRMCLEERGYEILDIVFNPEQAIVKCRETPPDLILMDICLRGEHEGITAAQTIKTEFGIPVVYLTGCSENLCPGGTVSQEPDPWVKKPFLEEELCAVIETALKNRGRNS
ncbi:MAG: response regulator [Desulfomonilaceae bacterium]